MNVYYIDFYKSEQVKKIATDEMNLYVGLPGKIRRTIDLYL